jgi:hypothetical protein
MKIKVYNGKEERMDLLQRNACGDNLLQLFVSNIQQFLLLFTIQFTLLFCYSYVKEWVIIFQTLLTTL